MALITNPDFPDFTSSFKPGDKVRISPAHAAALWPKTAIPEVLLNGEVHGIYSESLVDVRLPRLGALWGIQQTIWHFHPDHCAIGWAEDPAEVAARSTTPMLDAVVDSIRNDPAARLRDKWLGEVFGYKPTLPEEWKDFDLAPKPYHGTSIEVGGKEIGRIKSWNPITDSAPMARSVPRTPRDLKRKVEVFHEKTWTEVDPAHLVVGQIYRVTGVGTGFVSPPCIGTALKACACRDNTKHAGRPFCDSNGTNFLITTAPYKGKL